VYFNNDGDAKEELGGLLLVISSSLVSKTTIHRVSTTTTDGIARFACKEGKTTSSLRWD